MTIEIDHSDQIYFEDNSIEKNIDIAPLIKALYTDVSNKKNRSSIDILLDNLLLGIFVNYQIQVYKYTFGSQYIHDRPLTEGQSARHYILDFFSSMKNIQFEYEGHSVELPRQEQLANLVPQLFQFVEKLFQDKIFVPVSATTMNLVVNDETESVFKQFSRYYLQIKGISAFLKFKWRSLSGGEQSYLSLMSRFYHVKHHRHGDLPNNLIIMIDEGDIGYHPEWQRRFLNTTIGFLKRLFVGHTVQVIFTANSPFISSDLPKSNVIFIEKVNKELSIFHGKDNNRQSTFAANVHTLFADSFYLNGVLMDDFAKERINDIIKFINDKRKKKPNSGYKKTIDMIGEPALRIKLQDMWSEKFGLAEEREQLLKRLEEIDRQTNINSDDQKPS
ncbi:hypothetical protein [Chitinophaga defluvii]|uniref:AbiEii toxin of type IV toxin-antitoxin system n=1 Tax=Chitinophaga defluvii TaxID=3163343 RepID=A0ABV2TBD8_9BACT